jgi:hypothetical protein
MPRQFMPDSELVKELRTYLNGLVELRVNHVRSWLDCNLGRFQGGHAAIEDLRRRFDNMVIEMKTNVQICGAQCASCDLHCVRSRLRSHEGDHNCNTDHKCAYKCGSCNGDLKQCGTRYVILSLFGPLTEMCSAGHPGKHLYVDSGPRQRDFLIIPQMCCNGSLVWPTL